MTRFTRAIVRAPAENFADGITTSKLGPPDYELALVQHQAYCDALEHSGLTLTFLPPDAKYPDGTFIEDTAVVSERAAILARPGAASREGEVQSVRQVLLNLPTALHTIDEPGTLDGGDVCQAGDRFLIGISERTNESGAQQLATILASVGYRSTLIDISSSAILHLKSATAYLGENRLAATKALAEHPEFRGFEMVIVNQDEAYAANCIGINHRVLIASGFPAFASTLRSFGYQIIELDMSEFQKMDGGLSCLSLRF